MNKNCSNYTERDMRWIGEAVTCMFTNQTEARGVTGYKKILLLFWLLDNRDNIPSSYRKIADASNVSLAMVHRTFADLLELGKLKKEVEDPNIDLPEYSLVFND